jgi:hypothetical protein
MTLTLDEQDYLIFQLYNASKTPRIRNARIRNWIVFVVLMLCLAYLFRDRPDNFLRNYFLVMAIIAVPFYPFYSRWRYKRHYSKYVRDTYKDKVGLEAILTFTPDAIHCKDRTGEMVLYKSEIEAIDVIQDYYFLRVKGAGNLVFPKAKVDSLEALEAEIRSLLERGGIKHTVDLNWKWR